MKKANNISKRGIVFFAIFFAALTVWLPLSVFAQEPVSEARVKAMDKVTRMADDLSQAKSFSVEIEMGFDVVQPSGQKVEFGETRKVLLERPDHLRIEEVKRDGAVSQITFDGKELSLYYPKANVYASQEKSGTVDDVIKYFTEDLDLRLPLAQMLSSKLSDALKIMAREAAVVEVSLLAGTPCDHLALRGDDVDVQIWAAKGTKPLPKRVVITYKKMDGQPQFWANFSGWNFSPQIAEGSFGIKPEKNAKQIAFSPKQVALNAAGENLAKEAKV